MRGRQGVLHNIGILTLAQAAAQLLNVWALVYLARVIGSHWFGVVQVGVAFSGYALVAAEWGMWTLGIRQVARLDGASEVRAYVDAHLGLLSLLAVATLAVGAAVLPLFPAFALDRWIFWLYLASVVPQVFMLDWVGIGLERMRWVGLVKTCRSLFYALFVLLLLKRLDGVGGWPAPRWVPVMFLAGFVISNRVMAAGVARWLGGGVRPRTAPRDEWRRRLVAAGPIGAGNLTTRVVFGIDVIVLGAVASPEVVGSYSAAAKILFVLIIAVEVLWKAFLPRLSRLWQESRDAFRSRLNLYLGFVIAGFLPVAAGGYLLGERLMTDFYGAAFHGAGPVFRILSFSYVVLSIGMFLGNTLIASDRQQAYFPPLLASAVVALGGCAVLAPRYGALGACWAMLSAHTLLFLWTSWICRRLLSPRLLQPTAVGLVASGVMAGVLHLLPRWHALVLVAAGGIAYLAVAVPLLAAWARTFPRIEEGGR